MTALFRLLWYHGRLAFAWAVLIPPLLLTVTVTLLTIIAPPNERSRDLAIALEGGLPFVAALLAAPLLIGERERNTLCWAATRVSLIGMSALRLALLALYLVAFSALALLTAALMWHLSLSWTVLFPGATRALTFAALGLLAASWGRSTVHGYLAPTALWLGLLMFGAALPRQEPWLTLNPFAWSAGYAMPIVERSMVAYAAIGLGLLLPQLLLLRPERLLRPT